MKKFSFLKLRDLRNSQHFDFIEAFIAFCVAANFVAAKIVSALATLRALFAVEDSYFKTSRASELVARRTTYNNLRILYYVRLHRLVNVWAGIGLAPFDEAATELKKIFKLYKLNTRAQLNELSGGMTNLCNDLSTEENLARLATIGGTEIFNQMVAANEEVKAIRIEEGTEESRKVASALLKARKATDEAYDNLCNVIEATELLADDPSTYETFIQEWNGTIKLYNDMLDRKNGISTAGEANEGSLTPNPSPEGEGSGGNGGGSGSGNSGNSGDSGSGSGSGTGSGGDNGGDNGGGNSGGSGSGDNGGDSGDNGGGGSDWGNGSDE